MSGRAAARPTRAIQLAQSDRGRALTLRVDMTACEGRGLCAELLPEVIVLDDWGFPIIVSPVPERLADEAAEAVMLCPRLALTLQDG
jgi:ferredoxin